MNAEDIMREIRNIVRRYDNNDINVELQWADQAIDELSELVLRYDMEQER